ncbi:hypothetical protein ASPZODRAFT_129421 [Penicilliopsis zonata CBS 506.65]|uniref:Uncharacterized protein n=1 Tax=Penicilliopsis zonata CBS 506.65 TaxID=1073090 RepID=A0A1L9SP83_9EURO|nr:hypothetical protein ASPZODRAFT_129421 [Penicilliopsis zonata CBS 506.65]OJJ49045.1 hypothetical protein ASPZODRAFT_129421 [Penicilliopsis zonata CBS 506.65]
MKVNQVASWITLVSGVACSVAASLPAPETPHYNGLVVREDETAKKIWSVETSTIVVNYANTFGIIAGGIAAIIVAFKKGSTSGCTVHGARVSARDWTEEYDASNSSSYYEWDLGAISDDLQDSGFNIDYDGWSYSQLFSNTSEAHYTGTISNNGTSISGISLNANGSIAFHAGTSSSSSSSSDLQTRTTTLSEDIVYVMYHATGKCYTTHSETEVAKGIKKAFKKITSGEYYASCWALRFGSGSWHGHLKILGVYTDKAIASMTAYYRECTADS